MLELIAARWRVCIAAAFAILSATAGVQAFDAQIALDLFSAPRQSIYEFRNFPGYMLLNVGADGTIRGLIRSRWENVAGWKVEGVVAGPGTMVVDLREAPAGTPDTQAWFDFPAQGAAGEAGALPEASERPGATVEPAHRALFTYDAGAWGGDDPSGVWRLASPSADTSIRTLAEFRLIWQDVDPFGDKQTAEDVLLPEGSLAWIPETWQGEAGSAAVDQVVGLFGHQVWQSMEIAGLPTEEIYTTTNYCDEMIGAVQTALAADKAWKVTISRMGWRSLEIVIKSHSSLKFFFAPNYWWKASFELEFDDVFRNDGRCSGVKMRLIDSIVCPGPADDDPEVSRPDCFQRTDYRSNAENTLGHEVKALIAGKLN